MQLDNTLQVPLPRSQLLTQHLRRILLAYAHRGWRFHNQRPRATLAAILFRRSSKIDPQRRLSRDIPKATPCYTRSRARKQHPGGSPPVPDLTFHRRINLNEGLQLRRGAKALSIFHRTLPFVRSERGAAVGRALSAVSSQVDWDVARADAEICLTTVMVGSLAPVDRIYSARFDYRKIGFRSSLAPPQRPPLDIQALRRI